MTQQSDDLHGHDLEPHQQMWRNFVQLMIWSAGAVIVVLALMWVFLI